MTEEPIWPRTVAFMDFGTNSIRLLVIRFEANHSYTVLHRLKETVRLGDGEFTDNLLQPDALQRAVRVARQFAQVASSAGAGETIAVATAATREAENRNQFVQLLREEAGIDLRIISGLEEARLIYLGAASGIHIGKKQGFFIDIGGGSTETAIGTQEEHAYLNSLKLGAIRLSNEFTSGIDGPIRPQLYEEIKESVRSHAARTLHELAAFRIDMALGSSGTIENLADVAVRLARKRGRLPSDQVTYAELRNGIDLLCSLPLEERRKVPGLNPPRADIIIGGAAIVDAFMADLGIASLRVSERGLREGLMVDYMLRHDHAHVDSEVSLRERSILQLGRTCRFNEAHARTTSDLALQLYDSAKGMGLHNFPPVARELLEYAALTHHIGSFLTYSGYQKHSYYLVRNAELLGFDDMEITLIALTVLMHRGSTTARNNPEPVGLSDSAQRLVQVLGTFVRLAENLDRSQAANVRSARFRPGAGSTVVLDVRAQRDWHVEQTAVENQADAFVRVFQRPLSVKGLLEPDLSQQAGA